MTEEQNQYPDKKKKHILKEDTGKTTPPSDPACGPEGETIKCVRPEQGPDVPPQEQTQGIP